MIIYSKDAFRTIAKGRYGDYIYSTATLSFTMIQYVRIRGRDPPSS